MQAFGVYAVAGAIALGTLAFLHLLVWRVQRQGWSLLFALSFGVAALIFAFDVQARPPGQGAHPLAMLLGAAGLLLGSWGLIDYAGLPAPWRGRLRAGIAAVVAVFVVWRLAGGTSRLAGFVIYAAVIAALAGIAASAMRREPHHGHAFVLVALALFPLAVLAAALGWLEVGTLRYLLIVPIAVLGMTVLTTGLLRAQRRADLELARRREAEAALRRLNESLEQRVAERTDELAAMVAGLESFNRSVSHDLRGPLGGIASAMDLAIEALERGDTPPLQRLLPAVRDQARVSAALVASLLELARAGRVELAVQEVATEPLVADALKALREVDADAPALPVTVQALPTVVADPGLLRQVFVNLIGNAVKFSRDVAAPQVEVGARSEPGGPVLYVRDNGVGFASAESPRLFEPFQRLHGQRYQGSGVGLSIVKRIVERHGGRVWAESEPGRGATFCFTLGRAGR
jgi:signal transduction histidine kinase